MSEQAEVEFVEAEPSPSPTDRAGVIRPAGTCTGIRVRAYKNHISQCEGKKEKGFVWFYPFILFMWRGLSRRQQVCDGCNQNL